jgi:hypothetical protein
LKRKTVKAQNLRKKKGRFSDGNGFRPFKNMPDIQEDLPHALDNLFPPSRDYGHEHT